MSDKNQAIEKKKVITPKFRVSFPSVFKPTAFENQTPKYSLVMLFPKTEDLSKLKAAVLAAGIEEWGPKEKWPKGLKLPFRDGDTKPEREGYPGHFFVSASNSKRKPGLVDHRKEEIINPEDFYAGCFARAEIIAFAYDKAGNKGISFSLQNIQKLGDGPEFSGRKRAQDTFDAVEDQSENPDNYSKADDSLVSSDDEDYDLG
jgi:hypothetical protein